MVPCHLSTLVLRVPIPHMTAHGCSTSADGRPAIHPTMSAARMSPCPTMPPNVLASDKDPKRARAIESSETRASATTCGAAQASEPRKGRLRGICASGLSEAIMRRRFSTAWRRRGCGRQPSGGSGALRLPPHGWPTAACRTIPRPSSCAAAGS